MTTFTILWLIAGFLIGWILVEFMSMLSSSTTPYTFNVALGFVGALLAYTILHHGTY